MKLKNALKTVARTTMNVVKDEPVNLEERIEFIEKRMEKKLSQFEDAMSTTHSIILKLSDENAVLKEENTVLKKMLAGKEVASNSLLDGIKERVVKPMMNEGKEFAELVFAEEPKQKKNTIEPETDFDKHKKSKEPMSSSTEERSNINESEKSHHNPKEKTVRWMRQKFGLSPHIEHKSRAKSKKGRKK